MGFVAQYDFTVIFPIDERHRWGLYEFMNEKGGEFHMLTAEFFIKRMFVEDELARKPVGTTQILVSVDDSLDSSYGPSLVGSFNEKLPDTCYSLTSVG